MWNTQNEGAIMEPKPRLSQRDFTKIRPEVQKSWDAMSGRYNPEIGKRQRMRHAMRYTETVGFEEMPRSLSKRLQGQCIVKEQHGTESKNITYRMNKHGKPKQKGSRVLPATGQMRGR